VRKAKFWFLDAIGCGLGGSQTVLARTAVDALSKTSKGKAMVIGRQVKVSVGTAAFLNAMSINALDFDDSSAGGHVSSTLIGTLLALLNQYDVDGRDLLLSYVVGYEVSTRITQAATPSKERFADVWGLGTHQTFGAVTSAAKLSGLNKLQTLNAMGIAGASAPVPSGQKWGWDKRPLTWMKDAVAFPAQIGIMSMTLAAGGFIGCRDILDGQQGFWRMAASDQCDFKSMTEGLGSEFVFMENSIKTYACCWFIHPTLDAIKSIVAKNDFSHRDIAKIEVWSLTDLSEMFNIIEPAEMVDAQFSLPYCVALLLLGIETGPQWFNKKLFSDEDVLSIGSRVRIYPDSKSDEIFHTEKRRITARVVISTISGESYEEIAPAPRGSPTCPVTEDEIIGKYIKLAEPVIGSKKAEELKSFILELESQAQISKLSELTSPA